MVLPLRLLLIASPLKNRFPSLSKKHGINDSFYPPQGFNMTFVPEEAWNSISANDWKPVGEMTTSNDAGFNFTMSNMLDYFIHRKAADGNPSNDFKNMNGHAFPLFKAGHIQHKSYNGKMLIKCKCHAEMKKNNVYLMRAVFNEVSDILFAVCGCAAGTGPTCTCKHIGALCYFLEEFCRLTTTSYTSSLQTWHQPRKRSSGPSTLDAIKFVKLEYGKTKKISSYLQDKLTKLPNPVAFSHVLPLSSVIVDDVRDSSIQLPLIPRSSQIRIQEAIKKEPKPISLQSLLKHGRTFLSMITMSEQNIAKIEVATRAQSQTPRWHEERHCRITSSNFGIICKGIVSTSKVKGLLYNNNKSKLNNSAILWGRLHESTAFEQYKISMINSSHLVLQQSGIIISRDGFLAASPDGMVSSADGQRYGVIEIKCPYSCRNMTVREACTKEKSFYCQLINNRICLKNTHCYYYQVQGAMAISGVEWCDFIVWTTNDMSIERIPFNQSFWDSTYLKLKSIYLTYILTEIIYPRIHLNLDIIPYPFKITNEVYVREP